MAEPKSPSSHQVDIRTLWRLGGLSVWSVIKQSFRGFKAHHLDARSAQFAFYSMLALAPLLILIVMSIAHMPLEGVTESFVAAAKKGLPPDAVKLIERQIADVEAQIRDIQAKSNVGLVLLALMLMSVAGSRVFLTIGAGLDVAYGVAERRHFWKSGGVALLLTIGVFLMLLIAMVLLVVGPLIVEFVTSRIDALRGHVLFSVGVRWGVACAFMLIATSVIYWLVPTTKVRWYFVSPGSVFATVGWVALTQGFRLYVENVARYNETYGALGGVVIMLMWLYMTGALLLMGGEVNSVIECAGGGEHQTSNTQH